MFKQKRQTTKPRRNQTRPRVLEVRVLSPRIAWFSFLKILGKLTKLACILAVITGIGWSVWQGIQRAFYENPDFRLQLIDLNTNPVIDEVGVVEAAGIDLTASLFEIDVTAVAENLKALPAIADARAERHLPGKLLVRVTPRLPQAWISTPESGLPSGRQAGAMLVDTFSMRPLICTMLGERPTMRDSALTPLGGGGALRSTSAAAGVAGARSASVRGARWLCRAALTAPRNCRRSTGLVR